LIVQVPVETKPSVPPGVIVQTAVVEDVNETARPELADAMSVGDVAKLCVPGFAKVIVCEVVGITEFEAADAVPVPIAFVAATLNVYAVPLVRPVTEIEAHGVEHEPVMPPGLDVAV
jgi:hypothetical protein